MKSLTSSKSEANRASNYVSILSLFLLLISVGLNVGLAIKLRSANLKILKISQEDTIVPGDSLPSVQARRLDGSPITFRYDATQRPTLIYVFSPTCVWCQKNLRNFEDLYSKVGADYNFIGLSISEEKLEAFVADHNWEFPVLKEPTPATVLAYRLGSTPQTILVSQDGHVLRNWSGAYIGEVKNEIEEYFGFPLPGILEISDQTVHSSSKE